MRLRASTDIGLRALMRLAGQPERMFTTEEVAGELRISRNHLIKIVQSLVKGGILTTQRGAGGGFRLARSADEITLGDVVRLLESDQVLADCFRADGGTCTLVADCRLKGRLVAAQDAFLRELDRTLLIECALPYV